MMCVWSPALGAGAEALAGAGAGAGGGSRACSPDVANSQASFVFRPRWSSIVWTTLATSRRISRWRASMSCVLVAATLEAEAELRWAPSKLEMSSCSVPSAASILMPITSRSMFIIMSRSIVCVGNESASAHSSSNRIDVDRPIRTAVRSIGACQHCLCKRCSAHGRCKSRPGHPHWSGREAYRRWVGLAGRRT